MPTTVEFVLPDAEGEKTSRDIPAFLKEWVRCPVCDDSDIIVTHIGEHFGLECKSCKSSVKVHNQAVGGVF